MEICILKERKEWRAYWTLGKEWKKKRSEEPHCRPLWMRENGSRVGWTSYIRTEACRAPGEFTFRFSCHAPARFDIKGRVPGLDNVRRLVDCLVQLSFVSIKGESHSVAGAAPCLTG